MLNVKRSVARILMILLLGVMTAGAVSGCGEQQKQETSEKSKKDKKKKSEDKDKNDQKDKKDDEDGDDEDKEGDGPVIKSGIEYFYLSYSTGSYANSGYAYEAERASDGSVDVMVKVDGMSQDDAPHFTEDEAFLDSIVRILSDNHVEKWDGFDGSAQDVLDGDSFSMNVRLTDGQTIGAHGYEKYPEGYGSVCGALDALFMDLYESEFPNKEKALKAYYSEQYPDVPFAEEVEENIRYSAQGGGYFSYIADDQEERIVYRVVSEFNNLTEDPGNYGYDEDRDMLIVRLYQEADRDNPEVVNTALGFDLYTVDDGGQITLCGSDCADPALFWNDGLYGYFFRCWSGSDRLIGYFAHRSYQASGGGDGYQLTLYKSVDGKLEKIADESVIVPAEHENWTIDDISGFVKIAEEHGFGYSLDDWRKHPDQPYLSRKNVEVLVDLYTKNNLDGKFYETLTATPGGEYVGEYGVSGSVSGRGW
ncbi:MAG: hypothetical protein K6B72_08380 [Lachnospiraceae bacterium]|nr:hypothetical protein [Lachnospiraceae bacterium]